MKRCLHVLLVLSLGCGSEESGGTGPARAGLDGVSGAAREAMHAVIARNGAMRKLFEDAHAFAIFPTVGKGGFIVGGGSGDGFVYEKGELIGTVKLSFVSVGAQVGGQTYIEVILFENKSALDRFKTSDFEFGSQVTAIAIEQGVAIDAEYKNGVAVYTLPKKGLMAEASISGQEFKFTPK